MTPAFDPVEEAGRESFPASDAPAWGPFERSSNPPPADDRWAIFDLVARFDDAVNRRNVPEFAALWAPGAVWEIGAPMTMKVEGAARIVAQWTEMVQNTQWLFRGSFAGVVVVHGDRARGRWPCIETGVFVVNGEGYDNRSLYEDEYVRIDGHWRFARRRYLYLWLSNAALPGGPVALGPELPGTPV